MFNIRIFGGDQLDRIEQRLARVEQLLRKNMAAIDDLVADVTAENTVIDSAMALIQGLKASLDAAGADPAKLAQLKTDIEAKSAALAAAVAANTPAASVANTAPGSGAGT